VVQPQAVTIPAPAPAQTAPHAVILQPAIPQPATVAASEATPDELIPGARIIADAYRQATGTHINRDALAERLRVPLHTAERLLDALAASEPHRTTQVPARLNGTPAVEALA
jgi:hypothetical protein